MKYLGLILLIVGIAMAAAFGARNPATIHDTNIANGQVAFLGAAEQEAFEAWCAALIEAEAPLRDGCTDPDAEAEAAETETADAETADAETAETGTADAETAETGTAEPTFDERVVAGNAEIQALRDSGGELTGALAAARNAWIDAKARLVEPSARAAASVVPAPGERLADWFRVSGVPFTVGLALVVIGAVLARRASHHDAGSSADQDPRGPVDFGALCAELIERVRALHASLAANVAPTRQDLEASKKQVEAIQVDCVERLVGARISVERRYGLATFAAIFGPLSGGERLMNRTWAALTDGQAPEAIASLEGAAAEFDEALRNVPGSA